MNVHLGFWTDVLTDCCHGVHPVAVDTLVFSDRPMLPVGRKEGSHIEERPGQDGTIDIISANTNSPNDMNTN